MGSPVSSVFANAVMEDVETRALETFPEPPPEISRTSSYPCPLRLWETYVDETFVIMKKSEVSEFFTYKERAPHNSLGTKKRSIRFWTY